MVRKEDLCDWFKNLRPCKRLDYMCGLLHMCLPYELRFIGTVLEDLAKKDFHYLRDAEIKANQPIDISNKNSVSLSDEKLRSQIIIALALLNSTNSSCAEVIFQILEKQFDSLTQTGYFDKKVENEIKLILTMASHHPAFKFYQKLKLGETLNKVEEASQDSMPNELELDFSIPQRPLEADVINVEPSTVSQPTGPVSSAEVSLKSIKIIDYKEEPQNKKNCPDYRIQTTWSNGDTTQVYMTYKQLQELHRQLLHAFPEEKKKHNSVPTFAAVKEPIQEQMQSLNVYLSHIAKAPANIFNRFGTLFHQATCHSPTLTCASQNQPPPQHSLNYQPSPSRGDQTYDQHHRHNAQSRMQANTSPPNQNFQGPVSSSNSPDNSRTSSPASSSTVTPGRGSHRSKTSNIELSLNQLLLLLNLEKYSDNLKEFTIKQVICMSKEDFAKAGLPPDAQSKLKSKLDQLNQPSQDSQSSSMEILSKLPPAEPHPGFSPFGLIHPYYMVSPPYHPYVQGIATYPTQHSHLGLLPSPSAPLGEPSPVNAETSPPASPLLQQQLSLEQIQIQGQGPLVPVSTLPVMSPPTAMTDVKGLKQWQHPLDSSGSEEDRGGAATKGKGRGRSPQQSQSMPHINPNAATVSAIDDAKLSAMTNSLSAPHPHSALISTEPRTDTPPPPPSLIVPVGATIVNGYMSDPPPHQLPCPSVIPSARSMMRSYKTAQPTHTGQKNLIPMPQYDVQHQPQGMGKNNVSSGAIHHSNLLNIHSLNAPPPVSSGSQVVLVATNPQTHMQQTILPPSLTETGNNYGYYLPSYHRIATSVANSPAIMTTTQTHGPPHSPAPAVSAMCTEQAQQVPSIGHSEMVDPSRPDGPTPPSHTPPNHNVAKPNADSGTPSPPLASNSNKQSVNSEIPPNRNMSIYLYQNGYMPTLNHYFHQPIPQPMQQHFPNGLQSDVIWPARFPSQIAHGQIPFILGNSMYQPFNPAINPTVTSNSSVPNPVPPSVPVSGKSVCYNCGHAGHKPSKCEENTMESISNPFHLDYKPKSDSE